MNSFISPGAERTQPAEPYTPQSATGSVAPQPPVRHRSDHWTCAKLWLRIQLDAFRLDPVGYVQAIAWRARGLRVRSRNRIAALAGRSPHAYDFWISCREPKLRPQEARGPAAALLPVIDCRAAGMDATLRSLPPGARPVLLRDAARGRGLAVGEIGDVGACFDGDEAWLLPVSSGDLLAEDALSIYGRAIAAEPDAGIVYADDDLIDGDGRRSVPHFKPDWNPDLFEHHDFLTGACAVRVRREDLQGLDGLDGRGWA